MSHAPTPPPPACLVLMCKAPANSKRRLAAEIGPLAAHAAEHLLACALEDAAAWHGPVCYAPASEADARWLADAGITGDVVVQAGANLGARINHVNQELLAHGLERQIFIGIDCPELDLAYLENACSALDRRDAVLGPASDGGVVLMAARKPWPELSTLAWSSARLLDELEQACRTAGLEVGRLATLGDVDSLEDLERARSDLTGDRRAARQKLLSWLDEALPA